MKTHTNHVLAPTIVASSQGDRAANAPSPAPEKHLTRRTLRRQRTYNASAAVDRPRLDVFPTPQPLVGEEKELVRVMTRAPEALREALIAAQEKPDAPLHISEIQIPPFKPLSAGND